MLASVNHVRLFIISPLILLIALVHGPARASVIGRDTRGRLTSIASRAPFYLSSLETYRVRHATGYVYCPGAVDERNVGQGSGFLIGDSREMFVVTVAHHFVDRNGRRREPLSACYFMNHGSRRERVPLDFSRKDGRGSFTIGTFAWAKNSANDYAVVRLKRPVKDAEPFTPAELGRLTADLVRTDYFAVSAMQEDFDSGGEPILQHCDGRRIFPAHDARSSILYTTCAATLGASGSVLLARLGGALVPVGLIQGSKKGPAGLPYDEATDNFTFVIVLDGLVLDAIRTVFANVSE